jgi:hypothetical protein
MNLTRAKSSSQYDYTSRTEPSFDAAPPDRIGTMLEAILSGATRLDEDSIAVSSNSPPIEACSAKQGQQSQCYLVVSLKFKADADQEARKIVAEHFTPVDRALHRKMLCFDFHLGEWDFVVYLPIDNDGCEAGWLPDGMSTVWRKEFYRREGGREKAQAVWKRYTDLVERHKTEIAVGPLGFVDVASSFG